MTTNVVLAPSTGAVRVATGTTPSATTISTFVPVKIALPAKSLTASVTKFNLTVSPTTKVVDGIVIVNTGADGLVLFHATELGVIAVPPWVKVWIKLATVVLLIVPANNASLKVTTNVVLAPSTGAVRVAVGITVSIIFTYTLAFELNTKSEPIKVVLAEFE